MRSFRTHSFAAGILLCLISLSNCSHPIQVKRYQLRGKIVRLDPQAHTALIEHEKIEGWMGAMTMEYSVKENSEFQALHDGERITATVFVRDGDYWIGGIQHESSPEK